MLLSTIGAEYCIICEWSHGPRLFLFAVAELLNASEIMNETEKQQEVRKESPPDPQQLLWEPFPTIYIVALSLERPCSDGLGLVYSASAQRLLLINCKYYFFATLASDLMTVSGVCF